MYGKEKKVINCFIIDKITQKEMLPSRLSNEDRADETLNQFIGASKPDISLV